MKRKQGKIKEDQHWKKYRTRRMKSGRGKAGWQKGGREEIIINGSET